MALKRKSAEMASHVPERESEDISEEGGRGARDSRVIVDLRERCKRAAAAAAAAGLLALQGIHAPAARFVGNVNPPFHIANARCACVVSEPGGKDAVRKFVEVRLVELGTGRPDANAQVVVAEENNGRFLF